MFLKFIKRVWEVENVYSFYFEPTEKIFWKPGQFLVYKLVHDNPDLRGKQRFFTISSSPFEEKIVITTKIIDDSSTFKKKLFSLKKGDLIEAKGPDGHFTIDNPEMEYLFIAGGIGITPFHSILKSMDHKSEYININLYYANKDENIVFRQELDEIAKRNPGLKITYFISPNRITKEVLEKSNLKDKIIYVSGPDPMVYEITNILNELGVDKERVIEDYFSNYPEI